MNQNKPGFDRTSIYIGVFVWIAVFIIYNMTKAPTLSFWDCGEFIAACVGLQVPHPPGSPFYIMLGRVFSLLPIASDLAVRVNLLSAISSSFTAFFGYLAAVHILKKTIDSDGSLISRIMIYAGGACGAFFLAFGNTNWNNSVEAEVYGLAMMLMMSIFWLALVYWDNKGSAFSEKIMYLIFFIALLGVGVHMTSYLILPVLAIFFICKKTVSKNIWYIFGVLFLIELFMVFAFSSQPNEIPFYIPLLLVFLIFLFYIFSFEKIDFVYLISGVGMFAAILPLFGDLLYKSDNARFGAIRDLLGSIGKIAFAALFIYGLYLLSIYLKSRKTTAVKTHHLIASLFVLISSVMVFLLYPLHGMIAYKPFLVLTLILGSLFLFGFKKDINWLNLIAIGSVSLVIIGVKEFIFGMIGAAVLIILLGVFLKSSSWKSALMIILVSFLGYSTHLYIPIRSQQNPIMNENNPGSSVQATIDYIERKQYGSMSMTERMFKRRAEWTNQFGVHRHMGFWGYFDEQYGLNGPVFIPLFMIGMFGIWEVIRKRASIGIPFFLAIILSSVGLILYMNFADGTRIHPTTGADYLEVRDRDYFFTPAFIFFGLAIGIGVTFVINAARVWFGKHVPAVKNIATIGMFVLFLLPFYAVAQNYQTTSRANNYMPYDYGWNILTSAEQNAVLFTVGDNDTFTLWCLQDVYNVRRDVAVVNLSLANTQWYIKQLPTNLNVKTSWSESRVDQLRPFRDQLGNAYRLSDQVVSEVIKENFGRRPINFSVTVPNSRWRFFGRSIDSLMSLHGMVWRMTREGGGPRVEIDSSFAFLMNPERMRLTGINDESIYKDETTKRLTRNYGRTYIKVANILRQNGELEKVESLMSLAVDKIPQSTNAINYLATHYSNNNKEDELLQLIESNKYGDEKWLKTLLARLYLKNNEYDKTELTYKEILNKYPDYRQPFEDLMRMYYEQRDPDKMKLLVQEWLEKHPDDKQIRELLNSIDREFKRIDQEESIQQP